MPEDREIDRKLESELRQSMGREWTEEAAEDERLTELMRTRRLALGDHAMEFVHRGQWVRAETAGEGFAGEVISAGSDYALVERAEDIAAIRLDVAVWTIATSQSAGRERSGAATTLKAYLSELESTGEVVQIHISDGQRLVGPVSVVATDHIVVSQDALEVLVPLGQVAAVVRSKPRL